jgi:beta-galactosidase/beta-glucuronidase
VSEEHPRPLLQRAGWTSLDGVWDFALDRDAKWRRPGEVAWDASIRVPFAPETPASGVAFEGEALAFWYRRRLEVPALAPGERWLVHFGAVDHEATAWIDGRPAGRHEGGYTPFCIDVGEHHPRGGACELVVRAFDDPRDLSKPRGKQTWRARPHAIWYPRSSGIWRTVWAERVPAAAVTALDWSADWAAFAVGLEAAVEARPGSDLRLRVRLAAAGRLLVDDVCRLEGGRLARRFALPDGADERSELAWSPDWPRLIDAELTLLDAEGRALDAVSSYTAVRRIGCEEGRFTWNGRPVFLRLALDQGYWPETGATPPDTAALRRDVELAKQLGFHGVRKHQKTEDPRWLAWADRLGLLVFPELPAAQRFDATAVRRGLAEWTEIVRAHRGHPCVAGWVPVNESWGVPALADDPGQRSYVRALVETARALDPTRPVAGNDGWEIVGGDLVCAHDYDQRPAALAARWRDDEAIAAQLRGFAPVTGPAIRRRLLLEPAARDGRPVFVSEFGGIGLAGDPQAWGYSMARDPEELLRRYGAQCRALASSEALSGFCYTQLTDTYQEENGLLRMDRTPKAPIDRLALATAGLLDPEER